MKSHSTILIIGGGIAGLAAAHELVGHNFNVVLLEAQSRLGGRILTQTGTVGEKIELGAEFVHGRDPELWRILEYIPLRTREASDQHLTLQGGGLLQPFAFQEVLKRVTKRIDRKIKDETFADFLNNCSFHSSLREIA